MELLATITATIAMMGMFGLPNHPHYHRVRVVHRYRTYSSTVYKGEATYYSYGACDPTGGGSKTAGGSIVHFGEVANSVLPIGSKIHVDPPILGQSDFVVEDRFGSEQEVGRLDVWLPCGVTIPNPEESFKTYTERVVVFYKRVLNKEKHKRK